MSIQPSIDSYFGKRKRIPNDDVYKSKILKIDDKCNAQVSCASKVNNFDDTKSFVRPLENYSNNDKIEVENFKVEKIPQKIEKIAEKHVMQLQSLSKDQDKQSLVACVSPVKFHLLGNLSPAKKSNSKVKFDDKDSTDATQEQLNGKELREERNCNSGRNLCAKNLNFNENKICPTEDVIKSAKQLVTKIKETQKKLATDSTKKKKQLSLKEIKDKINRSSKLNELKKSINQINQHAEELIELEKKKLDISRPRVPKFETFDVTIPVSPSKNSIHSSVDLRNSPIKPAYERFASLTDSTTLLPLPFGYQRLYELFCAADTICSMISNRKEIITFKKLKPAVEEMTRKSFTTRHLGQIATVFPGAYSFHQQKLRNYGSTSKADKYELVITPRISSDVELKTLETDNNTFIGTDHRIMSHKNLKSRKEIFYKNLLERTKDYHEEFLKGLQPPIVIERNQLKRWHPNFMVDEVPDVNPQELPEPPNSEKPFTAKEILGRAKEFLKSNERLHKALEEAAENSEIKKEFTSTVSLDIKQKVDARLKDPLKGISTALLNKVRAKQAAKALDAMRMTPEQEKEILMYTRLPEFVRIIRTAFINEQKAVLLLEVLIEKIQFSYNRALSLSDVETHIRLLSKILPEWLSIVSIRNVQYVKINRTANQADVLTKLKKIVDEKKRGNQNNFN